MCHAMCSTLQSQNVLVELTHKHARTCINLSQIPPASDGLPLIVTTLTVFKGAIPCYSISLFTRNNQPEKDFIIQKQDATFKVSKKIIKQAAMHKIWTFKPAGVEFRPAVPELVDLVLALGLFQTSARSKELLWGKLRLSNGSPVTKRWQSQICLNF